MVGGVLMTEGTRWQRPDCVGWIPPERWVKEFRAVPKDAVPASLGLLRVSVWMLHWEQTAGLAKCVLVCLNWPRS